MTDKGSLDEALKAFASEKVSPLDEALRQFAKDATKKPPPAPTTPQPEVPLPPKVAAAAGLDISPQTHLRAAYSYIEDIEKKLGSVKDLDDTTTIQIAINDAASHLARAHAKDPLATFTIDGKNGPVEIGHDFLAAETLHKEGLIYLAMARIIDHMTDRTNSPQARSDLLKAIGAWEKAAAYRPQADFYTYMAEAHLKLDNRDAAKAAMQKAVQLEPGNLKAIKFLDSHGAALAGLNTPPPEPKKKMKLHVQLALGGLGCFVVAIPLVQVGRAAGFLPALLMFIAFGLWGFAVYFWRKQDPYTQSNIPGTYEHWKEHVQRPSEMRKLQTDIFHRQYEEERREKRERK